MVRGNNAEKRGETMNMPKVPMPFGKMPVLLVKRAKRK